MLRDNSISALTKCFLFQNDPSAISADLITELLSSMLPITNDLEEAQGIHELLLTQALAGNKNLADNQDLFKGLINRMKEYAEANQADPEKDILGEKGKALMGQVLS